MRRKVACSSIASGVVRSTGSSTPPTIRFTVPSSPVWIPVRSRMWRTRNAVVVFPFVPVMPTTRSSSVGSPKKRAAACAIAARASRDDRLGDERLELEPALDHDRGRAGLDGVGRELVAVGGEPGDREEEDARARLAAVVGEARDVGVGVADDLDHVGPREQLAKLHRGDSRNPPGADACGYCCGICRYGSANFAISPNAGAATVPP